MKAAIRARLPGNQQVRSSLGGTCNETLSLTPSQGSGKVESNLNRSIDKLTLFDYFEYLAMVVTTLCMVVLGGCLKSYHSDILG